MKRLCSLLTVIALSLTLTPAKAQQAVTIDYNYSGNTNLSDIRSSLTIAPFTDSRAIDNPTLIVAEDLGNPAASAGYQAEQPLADIVRDAFVQLFSQGGVNLVETGGDRVLLGDIGSTSAQIVERGGVASIQLTIRAQIQLQGRGRTLYESNMFGRGSAPVEDGIEAAVHSALNRILQDFTRDDYFMMEL